MRTDLHLDDPVLAAWRVIPADFPADGTPLEQLNAVVRYAVLAPSSHNTQPWLFRAVPPTVDGDRATLEVRADRSRGLAVVDHDDRELTISVGAAVEAARIAAAACGLRPSVTVLPADDDPDLVAVLTVQPVTGAGPADDDVDLAALAARRRARLPFEDRPLPDELLAEITAAAADLGVTVTVISGDDRLAAAHLVADGDRRQMADAHFRRELAAWVCFNHSARHDGIRGYGFGMHDVMSTAAPLAIRTFDLGDRQAAHDEQLAEGAPVLLVLGTAGDDPEAWVATGRALQRVLVTLTAAGATASYLNQPVEVPELRTRLAELTGAPGHPQLLLRAGYGPPVNAEPRRWLEDVLLPG